jgi:hypothetical protein
VLLELFDQTDENQKVMIAELYRNLGQFEQCMALIDTLPADFDWLKDKFTEQCDRKNCLVFRLR